MTDQDSQPDQPSPDPVKPELVKPVPVRETRSEREREMTSARREMREHLYAQDRKKRKRK